MGPNYEIVSNLGQRAGSNLFHSFGVFNVNAGESATFTGDGALGHIDNILGRVTGGASSNLDGRVASTIPGANLFLLNPAGILFGPNASLDLQGSFHASTADFIRLGDGVRFNALPSGQDALLTTAPPEAFGFLEDHPARIEVNDSFLKVLDGRTLSLVGGDITVQNGAVYAPDGQINLISTASAGEVTSALSGPKLEANVTSAQLGTIIISRDPNAARPNIEGFEISDVDASGPVGGAVVIRGGQFVVENAFVQALTFGGNDGEKGAGIDIRVGTLDMHSLDQDIPALISTDTFGEGDGGDVFVETDIMRLSGAGFCETCFPTGIFAQTLGEGDAGNIKVKARQMNVETGATISNATFSEGKGGDLDVDADNITLDGEATGFTTQSFPDISASAGDAGGIDIKTNTLTLINGAQIISATGGPGRAGDISVQAEEIFLSGGSLSGSSSITSQQLALDDIGAGDSGDINVITRHLEVRDGANINAVTFGQGQAGNMSVTADNILLVGDPSILFTGLSNETQNEGNAGNLTVTANTLDIRDKARIEASTLFDQETGANQFSGKGGNITLTANDIFISGEGAGIVAKSTNRNPAATSGRIQVIANDSIRLEDRGQITVETVVADAGDIDIQVGDGSPEPTGIFAVSDGGTGAAGTGTVTARELLEVRDGAEITTSTLGDGDAGAVSVAKAGTIKLVNRGRIASESGSDPNTGEFLVGTGNAGRVSIDTNRLEIADGGSITTTTRGPGRGGTVAVTADEIVLEGRDSGLFARAEGPAPGSGGGGDLTVNAASLMVKEGATISASTFGSGSGGNLSITAAHLDLRDDSSISSQSRSDSPDAGRSGEVSIRASDVFRIFNGSQVSVETAQATAGDITLDVGFLLHLRDGSSITTSVAGGQGDGGNISIDPVFTVLDRGSRIVAQAREGAGGNIRIVSDFFFASPDSVVSASSDLGIDGVVDIESPDTDVISGALELPESFLDAARLLSDRCSARTAKGSSSLIVSGRGGVPPGPETMLPVYGFDISAKADGGADRPLGEADSLTRNCPAN